MKKILMMMVAMVAAISMSAQTYVAPKFTDNTYVSIRYGVTALTHPGCLSGINWAHSLAQQSELQFGKYITPKFGVALDGVVSWDTFSCTKLSDYTVPFVTVSALAKYRLIDTHKFALTAVTGPGWAHGFYKDAADANDLMAKFQVELAYKVTDRLAVEVVPELNYNITNFYAYGTRVNPRFDSRNSWYGVNVGVTYRLGDGFKKCPYAYTQGDVDHLNATINDLRAALDEKPREVVKETVKTVEVTKAVQAVYTVLFAKNSAELTEAAKATLDKVAGTVDVVATASPEGTAARNDVLSQERADVVKTYLEGKGVKVTSAKGLGVDGPASNRIATVFVK